MGYFEGLTSSSFKITQDGRRLFFPWGVLGSGYALASEQDYQRLRRRLKAYMIVTLVLIIGSGSFQGYIVSVVVVVLLLTFYLVWMWHLLRRLKVADERLSLQESMTSGAQAHGVVVLWLLEIASLVFVCGGIFMFIVDPNQWLVALAGIFFFGLGAVVFARMLVLRRRSTGVVPEGS